MNLSAEWTSMTDFANKPPVLDLKAVEAEAVDCLGRRGTLTRTDREYRYAETMLALLALLREGRMMVTMLLLPARDAAIQPARDWLAKASEGQP